MVVNLQQFVTERVTHLDIVKYLSQDKHWDTLVTNSVVHTSLHLAVYGGHLKVLAFFISQLNCDPNTPDRMGRTPLHTAA